MCSNQDFFIEEELSILKIVLRNLSFENWKELLPEAQEQILIEVLLLFTSKTLSSKNIFLLRKELFELIQFVEPKFLEKIMQILTSCEMSSVYVQEYAQLINN